MPVLAAHKHILSPLWNFYLAYTGAKPVLGPRCMIPYMVHVSVCIYIVVGDNTCQNVLHILSPHIVKHFKKILSIDRQIDRSIDRSREMGCISIFNKFKKNKFHVWVYPTVDGPSRYDYKKIDGVYNKKCFCFFIMTVSQRLWCWFDMTSSVPCIIT